jgi:hypothetical protein
MILATLHYIIDVTEDQHYDSILTGFFVTVGLFLLHAIQGSTAIKPYLKKKRFKLKKLFHCIHLDKILYNLKKIMTRYTDVRTVAVNHNYLFLFTCCEVLLQHVSARIQEGIIVLTK